MDPRISDSTSKRIRVRDLTLRDGLQSIPEVLSTSSKLQLYDALVAAGVRALQITSFVSPDLVPQLADAEVFWKEVSDRPQRKSVLVGNLRGFERARSAGAQEIEAVVSLSETYNRKNVRRTVREALDEIIRMDRRAAETGLVLTVALANCFHCVFEGQMESTKVLTTVDELSRTGIQEILICDTTGYATPDKVHELMSRIRSEFPQLVCGVHLHDTRGRGLANAIAALTAGIEWFDATVGGLGGSPFAPGMGGNLSLEIFVDTLADMQIDSGIDVKRITDVGRLIQHLVASCKKSVAT